MDGKLDALSGHRLKLVAMPHDVREPMVSLHTEITWRKSVRIRQGKAGGWHALECV